MAKRRFSGGYRQRFRRVYKKFLGLGYKKIMYIVAIIAAIFGFVIYNIAKKSDTTMGNVIKHNLKKGDQ